MANISDNFSGIAFQNKFNLTLEDWRVDGMLLICSSMPNLTDEDLLDCVVDLEKKERVDARRDGAKLAAKNIPGWSTWNNVQALDWYNQNLSDARVDAIANLADAKVMLKQQNAVIYSFGRMLIAMRDKLWPDLGET